MPFTTFPHIPTCLPICFDKAQVCLEFREFAVDNDVLSLASNNHDAVAFWMAVPNIQSTMGELSIATWLLWPCY